MGREGRGIWEGKEEDTEVGRERGRERRDKKRRVG